MCPQNVQTWGCQPDTVKGVWNFSENPSMLASGGFPNCSTTQTTTIDSHAAIIPSSRLSHSFSIIACFCHWWWLILTFHHLLKFCFGIILKNYLTFLKIFPVAAAVIKWQVFVQIQSNHFSDTLDTIRLKENIWDIKTLVWHPTFYCQIQTLSGIWLL